VHGAVRCLAAAVPHRSARRPAGSLSAMPEAPLPQFGALACRATRSAFACGAHPHGGRHAPPTEQALKAGQRRARRRRLGGLLLGRQRRARRAARQGVSAPSRSRHPPLRRWPLSCRRRRWQRGSPQGPVGRQGWFGRSKAVVSAVERVRRAARVALLGRPGTCGVRYCLWPAPRMSVCSYLRLHLSHARCNVRAAHPTMQCHLTCPHRCGHPGERPAGQAGAAAVDAVHAHRFSAGFQQCRAAP